MNATVTSTVTAQSGVEYGASCETYEEKANKKLANSSTIVLCGYGASIKVEKNALRPLTDAAKFGMKFALIAKLIREEENPVISLYRMRQSESLMM